MHLVGSLPCHRNKKVQVGLDQSYKLKRIDHARHLLQCDANIKIDFKENMLGGFSEIGKISGLHEQLLDSEGANSTTLAT